MEVKAFTLMHMLSQSLQHKVLGHSVATSCCIRGRNLVGMVQKVQYSMWFLGSLVSATCPASLSDLPALSFASVQSTFLNTLWLTAFVPRPISMLSTPGQARYFGAPNDQQWIFVQWDPMRLCWGFRRHSVTRVDHFRQKATKPQPFVNKDLLPSLGSWSIKQRSQPKSQRLWELSLQWHHFVVVYNYVMASVLMWGIISDSDPVERWSERHSCHVAVSPFLETMCVTPVVDFVTLSTQCLPVAQSTFPGQEKVLEFKATLLMQDSLSRHGLQNSHPSGSVLLFSLPGTSFSSLILCRTNISDWGW